MKTSTNYKLVFASFILLAAPAVLSSCGGSTEVTSKNERSVGQQLTDLNQAYLQGIISEKEYAKMKQRIIRDND